MKKIIGIVLSLTLAMIMFVGVEMSVSAEGTATTDDGFEYYGNVYGDVTQIEITGYSGTATSVIIPETIDGKTVSRIGDRAFISCTSITSIQIPNTVTYISEEAFRNCSSLTNITLPESIVSIGDHAFSDCTSLTNITIPSSVENIGIYAFNGCTSLESVTIPGGITSIDYGVFFGCSNLTDITIPNSVTSIGSRAFYLCESLANIDIPDSVTSIGEYAFWRCVSLEAIEIPNGVKSIEWSTFDSCYSLASAVIPESVTTIGNSAFYDCSALTNIVIPSSVTSIGSFAFAGTSLETVTISKNIISIGSSVFSDCTKLAYITVDENNTEYCSVDGILFDKEKTALIKYPAAKADSIYNIPESVTTLFYDTFSYCANLRSVTVPHGVTHLTGFEECSTLRAIAIPLSVTSVAGYAFDNCNLLSDVYYWGNASEWKNISMQYYGNEALFNATKHYNCNEHEHTFSSTVDGIKTCNVCGYVSKLRVGATSLTLETDLTVNIKANKDVFDGAGYTDPYVAATKDGETVILTEYEIVGGYYVFKLEHFAPRQMGDEYSAVVHGKKDGVDIAGDEVYTYSIKSYLCHQFKNAPDTEKGKALKSLIADLLIYGYEHQIYSNYDLDNPLTNAISEEELEAYATRETPDIKNIRDPAHKKIDNPTASWRSASITLKASIEVNVKFEIDNTDGVSVVFTNEAGDILDEITEFRHDGKKHVAKFTKLSGSQLSDALYVTVYRNGTAISNTLRYSVESYAADKIDDPSLGALCAAIMRYGYAAARYFGI